MNTLILDDKVYFVRRCGMVPFCMTDTNQIKILLGLKSNCGECYGDFGGGISTKETYIDGLIREVFEESGTLLFQDVDSILKILPKSGMIMYNTKDKASNSVYIEYLVNISYSNYYITRFLDHKISEHVELRWFDVIDGQLTGLDIKKELDGSLKPTINGILSLLKI